MWYFKLLQEYVRNLLVPRGRMALMRVLDVSRVVII